MKKVIRIVKRAASLALVSVMLMLLCSCESNEKSTEYSGYYIYYVEEGNTKLASEKYKAKSTETIPLIEEFIAQLSKDGSGKKERAISEELSVNGYNLLDGILTVDFGTQYNEMTDAREVLMRAAIVLTLSQIESVDYVAFTVNDEPILRGDGTMVGNMQATDFVDNLGNENNIYSATRFVLYYAGKDGTKLKEYDVIQNYYGDKSKEEYIVEKIIQGPEKEGYISTLSPDTQLLDVSTTDNICYVNFGDNFLSEQTGVSAELTIYSIVNSLSELNYVHKVQICVNGVSNITYKGVSLENAFIRNLDHIETSK